MNASRRTSSKAAKKAPARKKTTKKKAALKKAAQDKAAARRGAKGSSSAGSKATAGSAATSASGSSTKTNAPTVSSSKPTKSAQALALLRRSNGATLEELMKATGWQAHSVRGFLSGTVRKRMELSLQSRGTGIERRYWIVADDQTSATPH